MKKFSKKTTVMAMLATAILAPSLYVHAESTATITISGTVLDTTCSFDKADYPVNLDSVSSGALSDTSVHNVKDVAINVTCGSDATAVKISATGTPDGDDTTAFKNSGDATGVALRLQNEDETSVDASNPSTVEVALDHDTHAATYTFKAGYVATKPGQVTSGTFGSVINLTFDYS